MKTSNSIEYLSQGTQVWMLEVHLYVGIWKKFLCHLEEKELGLAVR